MDPEDPLPFALDGQMLHELPAAPADAIVEVAGPGSGSPLLSLELRLLGGALRQIPARRGCSCQPRPGIPDCGCRDGHGP